MRRQRTRRGVALLEVIIAIAILATVVASWTGLLLQLQHSLAEAEVRESEMLQAASLLAAAATAPRDSLDRWVQGRHERGLILRALPASERSFHVVVRNSADSRTILESIVRTPTSRLGTAP